MKRSKKKISRADWLIAFLLLTVIALAVCVGLQHRVTQNATGDLRSQMQRAARAEADMQLTQARLEEVEAENIALADKLEAVFVTVAESTTRAAGAEEERELQKNQLDEVKESHAEQIKTLLQKIEETEEKLEQLKVSKANQRRMKAVGQSLGEFTYRGETFQDVTIKEATPAELIVAHADGAGSFDFTHLSPELCQRYGYYRPTAIAYLRERGEAEHQQIAEIEEYKEATRAEELARAKQIADLEFENRLSDKRYEILKAEARVRSIKHGLATTSRRSASYSRYEQALVRADKELLRVQLELNAMTAGLTP